MTVGIIGTGSIGAAFARRLAQTDIPAILSNSRGPESLVDLVAEIGGRTRAGTVREAAAQDLVMVAVNWSKLPVALGGLPDFGGRIVIDANNPIIAPPFELAELLGRPSTEVFAEYVPGARVVKAFNHLPAKLLAEDPRIPGGWRVLFLAGGRRVRKSGRGRFDRQARFLRDRSRKSSEGGRAINIPGGTLPSQNLIRLD